MEFKGTKGKWEVYLPDHIGSTNVKFGSEEWNGFVELWHHHSSDKEAKANALLISKAPEMLEMLKLVSDGISEMDFAQLELILPEIEQLLKEATEI